METRLAGVPTGAQLAGTYGSGLTPVGTALALAPSGVLPVPANEADWVAPFDYTDRHCKYEVDQPRCKSWGMKNDPDGFCVGHRKKVDNGAQPPADEGLHQDASRP